MFALLVGMHGVQQQLLLSLMRYNLLLWEHSRRREQWAMSTLCELLEWMWAVQQQY